MLIWFELLIIPGVGERPKPKMETLVPSFLEGLDGDALDCKVNRGIGLRQMSVVLARTCTLSCLQHS
jgi:hypothetical protein